jgi:hypothetical protein
VRDAQLLDEARHPPVKHRVTLSAGLLRKRAGGEWIRRAQNLLITGATGSGKTWIAGGELDDLALVEPRAAL